MGGRAFLQEFPPDSLPRLSPSLYLLLKTRLTAALLTLYAIVEVPAEAPGKTDHGDIDFVVARPLARCQEVTPEQVGRVLGAAKSIELDGNRTSNYAIEISHEEWSSTSTDCIPSERMIYCQVDVKVCDSEEAVEALSVFHGYGDLGIIICAIAKTYGLSVNHKGLKIASPNPDPPMHLTSSTRTILEFMGLSMDKWLKGFDTVEDTFKFAATSRFFDPRRLHVPTMRTFHRSIVGRHMYSDFLVWAQDKTPAVYTPEPYRNAVEEALVVFGKKAEWDAVARDRYERTWLKQNFSGKLVAEWTGLGWRGVKAVMDDVRSSVGGERALVGMEVEKIKGLVMLSQGSLQLSE
ncbi:hypothetical protein PAXRUDRAFT_154810 [Paxillus rubicundulus Ve08.2h10]|uniref:Uncharacterized protein n=1 Tax=Paxillus rubicundulus Ve08.2h10 TaxID=930991 RepID=A0A0D0D1Q0_9AGAM|nr:hypothetical protein PAXRUDRAFT_154810 [Paxillus rubicundulus Ve08.2h10]